MKNFIILTVISLIFASCATVLSQKTHEVKIESKTENAQVQIQDSTYNLPAKINLKRSIEPLKVKYIVDTLQIEYLIDPKHTKEFRYGNLIFPLGYAIDLTNHKRFYYDDIFFINSDTIDVNYGGKRKKTIYEIEKGNIFLNASIPYVNSFYMRPENVIPESSTGTFGISLGADYFYRNDRFINFTYSYNMIFQAPVPVPISYDGSHEHSFANVFMLTNNHRHNRFNFGYGISYVSYKWIYHNESDSYDSEIKKDNEIQNLEKRHDAFGFTFPAYYRLGDAFYIGFIYTPTFYTPTLTNKFTYEHVISLDLKWKIRIKK